MFRSVEIVQMGYVVRDIDRTIHEMNRTMGLGPFFTAELEVGEHVYRGTGSNAVRFRAAVTQAGEVMIELLQLISTGPDAFNDLFPNGTEGLHHVATFCDDYELSKAAFVREKCEVASEFANPWGGNVCYVDTHATVGHMIELCPKDGVLLELYADTRAARNAWDGKTLIIPWQPK